MQPGVQQRSERRAASHRRLQRGAAGHTVRTLVLWLLLSMALPLVAGAQSPARSSGPRGGSSPIEFEDTTASQKLTFRHQSPITPERHIHLFMGSGVGWSDWDRDGDPDLLFCQGAAWPESERVAAASNSTAQTTRPGNGPVSNSFRTVVHPDRPAVRLCRNQQGLRFETVGQESGLLGTAYAMGLSIADYDNDGFDDLFVTGFFATALYRNQGDGTWADQTAEAGLAIAGFSTGCCWTDLDRDGLPDLFCARYLEIDPRQYPLCRVESPQGAVAISCNPKTMRGASDLLFQNLGDGRFTDRSESSGIATGPARQSLGVVSADLDDDGQADLYVANDTSPNDLWMNVGMFRLQERGLDAGAAVNRYGAAEAGMGIALADVDGDQRPDLCVTNYFNETNTLYRNEGQGLFWDVSDDLGIAGPSRQHLGFGVNLSDFNADGWPDLFVANGHVQDQLDKLGRSQETFAQQSQLLWNQNGKRFTEISRTAGAHFQKSYIARGSAVADYDTDGRLDLVVLNLNSDAVLLRNRSSGERRMRSVELIGCESNRAAIGAVLISAVSQKSVRIDRLAANSYLSCDDRLLPVAVARDGKIESLIVRWPNGLREQFRPAAGSGPIRLREGTGAPLDLSTPRP